METFKLLCIYCALVKPEESPYDTLKVKLKSQFGVKKLILAEGYCFYAYKQQDKQSLSDYLAKFCRLASSCQWSAEYLADNLCDKFVIGLRNERLLLQLLTQDHPKTLDELFQLAATFEVAKHEAIQRVRSSPASADVSEAMVLALKNAQTYRGYHNKLMGYPGSIKIMQSSKQGAKRRRKPSAQVVVETCNENFGPPSKIGPPGLILAANISPPVKL